MINKLKIINGLAEGKQIAEDGRRSAGAKL